MWARFPRSRNRMRWRQGVPPLPGPRRRGAPVVVTPAQVGLLLFVSALILLSYVFPVMAPDVRWALYVLLLVVVGWILILFVRRDTVPVPPFGMARGPHAGTSDELGRLVAALRRADQGMRYSQGQVVRRVRRAYLSRLALERGMHPREVDALLDSSGGLHRAVDDATIRRFLERSAGAEARVPAGEGEDALPSPVPSGESATRFLGRVLRSMEGSR